MSDNVSQTKTAWSESDYNSTIEAVPKTIRDSTVRIRHLDQETGEFRGSGTGLITEIIKDSNGSSYAIVITAGHVLNEKQETTLFTQFDENSFQSSRNTFIHVSPDIAIAAFKLDRSEENLPSSFGTDNLTVIDPSSIAKNINLIALGYPGEKDGNGFLVSQPYQFPSVLSFLNFENDVINAYGTTAAGMSGCPVVDTHGTLIGFLLGFDPNLGDLIFQDPKYMRIQPITQELLDQYKIFVEKITGSDAQ